MLRMEQTRDAHAPPVTCTVKDPVCGMIVDPATAKGRRVEHEGHEYAFCSANCRERFLADPARRVTPAQISREAACTAGPAGADALRPRRVKV